MRDRRQGKGQEDEENMVELSVMVGVCHFYGGICSGVFFVV